MTRLRARSTLTFAAAALASIALAGCSAGTGTASDDALDVVYIPGLTGNPFYSTVSCGAATQADADGVTFTTQGAPEFSVSAQTEVLNAVVASQPDAIMISITDPEAMIVPLLEAKDAGIDIIGIDGDLTDDSIMTTNIQSDGFAGGKQAGEALAALVGEKGAVFAISNATGDLVAQARTDGFEAAIAEYPEMEYLGIQYSNNQVDEAASIAATTTTTNSDVVGIFTAQTNNTEGALTGLREADKTGLIHVIGYDTSDPIEAALHDGTLDGTIVQNPAGAGAAGITAAIAASNGESVERNIAVDAILATPENVDSDEVQAYLYDVNCAGDR